MVSVGRTAAEGPAISRGMAPPDRVTERLGYTLGQAASVIGVAWGMRGPLMSALRADRTGGYQTGFGILAVLAGLGSIFFVLARRPARPRRDDGVVDTPRAP